MKTTSVGRDAEMAVASYLEEDGFKILVKNWRTRWCEVDIIAQKDKSIHFIDVKFRFSESHGSGFDYITSSKLRQLQFAARFWVAQNNWEGDYRILAAEVRGANFQEIQILEIE